MMTIGSTQNVLMTSCMLNSECFKLCSAITVPLRRKNCFKFWWSQDCLKDNAITSDKQWKARDLVHYLVDATLINARIARPFVRINETQKARSQTTYNDALLNKRGNEFWKCWNSKVIINHQDAYK